MPFKDPKVRQEYIKRHRATGAQDCEHKIRKDSCCKCNGCPHGRLKSSCKDCKGSQICQHNRIRHVCRECKILGIGGVGRCSHERRRLYCVICNPKGAYKIYQRQAEERDLSFTLTLSEFSDIVSSPCLYCGRLPEEVNGMGVDRVDNRQGYELGNCVPCCEVDNRAKLEQTLHEYVTQCERVAARKGILCPLVS